MIETKYELEICKQEFVDSFVMKHAQNWYDQPLCFKDRDRVMVKGNWFMEDYQFPVISVAYCKNTTEN